MLAIEKINHIDELLEKTGHETMNVEELHGLLTAIACGPVAVKPEEWLPLVFLREKGLPRLASPAQLTELKKLLSDFYADVVKDLDANEFAPLIAAVEEEGEDFLDPGYWCSGFMVGARFAPEAWHDETDTVLHELLAPIVFLSDPEEVYEGMEEKSDEEKQDVEEEFMDKIADVVPKIRAHFKTKRSKQ
ncbi:MAG: YecA family protein [Deltaproteobacteria bacterium]|nr:YecA family protein [Deltaproteobacteria bacterium]